MPIEILMPMLSPTMTSGSLVKWLVKEGDAIKAGSVIAEIETDKAVMDFEAVDEGTLGKILVQEGTHDVSVNQPIAILFQVGETLGDVKETSEERSATPVTPPAVLKTPHQPEPSAKKEEFSQHSQDPELPENVGYVKQTLREALRDAIAEEMRRDEDVFILGEEVAQYQGAYKVTQGLLEEFGPKRVIDSPISEHGFAGLGVGSAFAKLKPIVEFMTFNFSMQAIDQIINSAAKTLYMSGGQMGCPIVFRGPNGPASRVAAQHSQDYAAWYAHIPGLIVIAPYSAADAKGLLKASIRNPNPVIFLENELLYGKTFEVPDVADYVLPIGCAKIIRQGEHVTLVSYSFSITYCEEAAQQLAQQGISCEIIDLRTLRPLDINTVIESVKKTGRLVTVDQTWPICGMGSEIQAQVQEKAFDYLDAPVLKVTQKDVPMPYASNLEKLALPSVEEVISAVKTVCYQEG